jgi:hypothetical protein
VAPDPAVPVSVSVVSSVAPPPATVPVTAPALSVTPPMVGAVGGVLSSVAELLVGGLA